MCASDRHPLMVLVNKKLNNKYLALFFLQFPFAYFVILGYC